MPKPPKEDLFILPDEYKSCVRQKRSLLKSHRNEELNVETLVVVDKKMMQNHGHENITTYVLTILNMVGTSFSLSCVCNSASWCVLVCVFASFFYLWIYVSYSRNILSMIAPSVLLCSNHKSHFQSFRE